MDTYKQKFITKNRPYKALTPKGVVLHETATPGATDENEQKYFDSAYRGASAHAFVDWDSVTQCIPFNEVAWHAGPTANNLFIGVELCHATNKEQFDRVWTNGVELIADLFIQFGWGNVSKDNLLSHVEVSEKFKETNHSDPVEYFAKYKKTVENFRNDVQKKIYEKLGVKRTIDNVGDAIQVLVDGGVINSPDYWYAQSGAVLYFDKLLIKMANKLKELGV